MLGMLKASEAAGGAGVACLEGSARGSEWIMRASQVTARTRAFPWRRGAVGGVEQTGGMFRALFEHDGSG